jgi:photosystem I reaction center PsaK
MMLRERFCALEFIQNVLQIMVASTTACLVAGRFGLAPTVNKSASAGLKLQEVDGGVKSGDPAGAQHLPLSSPQLLT